MDRDKIVKALECCAERFGMCDECPYEEEEGCEAEMLLDASDLIRELTEENELLKAGISTEFTCVFSTPNKVRDCPINGEIARAKAETVRDVIVRISAMIGTYQTDSMIRVADVFKMLSIIKKEMLEEEQ